MKDVFECAWREISRRKSRTIANIIGYVCAVSITVILITIIMFSKSAESFVLHNIGTHFIAYSPLTRTIEDYPDRPVPYYDPAKECTVCSPYHKEPLYVDEGFTSGAVFTKIHIYALVEEANKIESVKDASPFLLFQFSDGIDGQKYTVGGFDPSNTIAVYASVGKPNDVIRGRYIEPTDSNVVMVHEDYAKDQEIDVGDIVTIAGRQFSVVGIIKPSIKPAEANIYMTFDDATSVINTRIAQPLTDYDFNLLLVEVKDAPVQKDAKESVKRIIDDPKSIIYTFGCNIPAGRVMGMGDRTLSLLTIMIFLSAIILALKTQFTSVVERRHDIGILKLIGWTNGNVTWQILTESVLQAVIGGIIGCILAVAISLFVPIRELLKIDVPVDLTIPWTILALIFILTFSGGIIAGIFPALRVMRQKPAEVLRRL